MHKILVCDDEIDVCDFIKHFFQDRGFEVTCSLDGEEAVRIARKQKFDVILLDVRMKKMSGIDALKNIRKNDDKVNVIMVTAVEDQDKMDDAKRLGVSHYITKPLVLEELESIIYKVTNKQAETKKK